MDKHIIQATRKYRRRALMTTEGLINVKGRLKNTRNGNPMYLVQCGDMLFRTSPDAMVNFAIDDYRNKRARVTLKEAAPRARQLYGSSWILEDIDLI